MLLQAAKGAFIVRVYLPASLSLASPSTRSSIGSLGPDNGRPELGDVGATTDALDEGEPTTGGGLLLILLVGWTIVPTDPSHPGATLRSSSLLLSLASSSARRAASSFLRARSARYAACEA